MSSGTQVELNWTGIDAAPGGATTPPASGAGSATRAYLTDEEILGIDPPSPKAGYGGQALDQTEHTSTDGAGNKNATVAARRTMPLQPTPQGDTAGAADQAMPEWMLAAAGDPKHGAEAQQLWQEHQAFRAVFSSPEEARAIKELFPGGAQEAQTLRQAAQAVDQLDAAIYCGDARAQSEVVSELARANPAAFRQLFSEAAKVLAGMGGTSSQVSQAAQPLNQTTQPVNQTPTLSAAADEGWGTQQTAITSQDPSSAGHYRNTVRTESVGPEPRITSHRSPVTSHPSSIPRPMRRLSVRRTTRWRGTSAWRWAIRWHGYCRKA